MEKYWDIIERSFRGYWNYLVNDITEPSVNNFFYVLLGLSLVVWALEILLPWRKKQGVIRKDFWLDGFYMFFNFFLFSLIGFSALSNVGVALFNDFLGLFGITNLVALEIGSWPGGLQLLTLFVVTDFLQWNIHRLLHRVPWLWEFHKVHHSVKEMGFAAHLRFHWMESVIYKSLQYIPLAMIGFSIQDFFLMHVFAILVGHLNHANLNWDYGWFKFIFNNPKMHLWHHAKDLPKGFKNGVNYGISLSIWDYLFKTAYVPQSSGEIELGFQGDTHFPQRFIDQLVFPLRKKKE